MTSGQQRRHQNNQPLCSIPRIHRRLVIGSCRQDFRMSSQGVTSTPFPSIAPSLKAELLTYITSPAGTPTNSIFSITQTESSINQSTCSAQSPATPSPRPSSLHRLPPFALAVWLTRRSRMPLRLQERPRTPTLRTLRSSHLLVPLASSSTLMETLARLARR